MGREQRFTEAQRQAIGERHREANAQARYGTGYHAQGWRPEQDAGRAFLNRQAQRLEHGAFNPGSWRTQYDAQGNLVGVAARARQTDRIQEYGSGWLDPSRVLKPGQLAAIRRTTGNSAHAQRRAAFREANPGAGMDEYLYHKYTSGLRTDPATGLKVNRYGDTYDPNKAWTRADGTTVRTGVGPGAGQAMAGGNMGGASGGMAVGGGAAGGSLAMGGGGRGGRAGRRGQPAPPDIESSLQSGLSEMLQSEGPFNDQVVQNLRSQARMDAYAPVEGQIRQSDDDAVQRGLFRSGIPLDQQRQAREGAAARYSQATTQIENNAVLQNHQARLGALDRAQKWLDSKRQWILANETNALNRELGLKQVALGYARIQAESSALDRQLSQSNYQFNQMNPNMQFTDPQTGQNISLPPGMLRYLDYFTG